ncbi:MAG: hypothetical protein ABJN65_01475 [Parasphingorhabdus sp.]
MENNVQEANFSNTVNLLGASLLAYILNLSEPRVVALLTDGGKVTKEQQAVLDQAEQVLHTAMKGQTNKSKLDFEDRAALRNLSFSNGLSVLNGLRTISGGNLPKLDTEDPVKRALAEMCLDCYPHTLLPEEQEEIHTGFMHLPTFFGSKKLTRFISAVRMDAALMKLFPNGIDGDFTDSQQYFTSFGNGSGTQLGTLPMSIIYSGIGLMHARNESSLSALQLATWEMLDSLRESLNGNKPSLRVYDIFDLVGLPDDFQAPIGASILSGIPKVFLRHVPFSARPRQDSEGNFFGCMLQRNCEYDLALAPFDAAEKFQKNWPVNKSLNEDMEHQMVVALATSLALNRERTTAARWIATVTIDPLYGVGKNWTDRSISLNSNYVASSDECEALRGLLEAISPASVSSIELAVKRLMSATTNRSDFEDSLVDSVIGLESLFGGRSEVSLSVASGVANLLGKTQSQRSDLFEQSKRVYNARSAVVHGSSKRVMKLDIFEIQKTATNLLRGCILELLQNRPELLEMTAEERVKELITS